MGRIEGEGGERGGGREERGEEGGDKGKGRRKEGNTLFNMSYSTCT